MTSNVLLLDAVLALTLVTTGLRVLLARDLFRSIVLFIIFSMLLGIAWCRLEAVDVALAEVAIGAGLTGALLLNTLAATGLEAAAPLAPAKPTPTASRPGWPSLFAAGLFAIVSAGGLAVVFVPLAQSAAAPAIAIGEALPHSGVANPVTAVLLNFRAHDTLLEVAVLLAAVFAVLPPPTIAGEAPTRPIGPVLRVFARLLVPVAVLVATYVLWAGTKAPGGAFQAAAILAAAGVLMIVCGASLPTGRLRRWQVLLVAGLSVFLLVGLGGIATGGYFLELSPTWAGASILLVETALTASIALILVVLFHATSPGQDEHRAAAAEHHPAAAGDPQHPQHGGANDIREPSP